MTLETEIKRTLRESDPAARIRAATAGHKPFVLTRSAIGAVMKLWGIAAVVVLGQLCIGETLAEQFTVDKATIEVSAIPEKTEVMLGEPARITFKVTNLSDRRMVATVKLTAYGHRPHIYEMKVVNAAGQELPAIPYMGIPSGCPIGGDTLKPRDATSMLLFLPHFAKLEKAGEYRVTISYKLPLTLEAIPGQPNQPINWVPVSCTTPIKVVPPDPVKFGALIEKWGPLMLGGETVDYTESQWAIRIMSEIHDERVIPHFARLAKTHDNMRRVYAGLAMERFRNDQALEVLKGLMTTKNADVLGMFAPDTPVEAGDHYASEVRRMAAHSLSRSVHPKALATLWALADHPREDIRQSVLRQAAQTNSPESRAVIKKLMKDPDENLRNEAWQCFRQLSHGKSAGSQVPPPPAPDAAPAGAPPPPPPPPPPPEE